MTPYEVGVKLAMDKTAGLRLLKRMAGPLERGAFLARNQGALGALQDAVRSPGALTDLRAAVANSTHPTDSVATRGLSSFKKLFAPGVSEGGGHATARTALTLPSVTPAQRQEIYRQRMGDAVTRLTAPSPESASRVLASGRHTAGDLISSDSVKSTVNPRALLFRGGTGLGPGYSGDAFLSGRAGVAADYAGLNPVQRRLYAYNTPEVPHTGLRPHMTERSTSSPEQWAAAKRKAVSGGYPSFNDRLFETTAPATSVPKAVGEFKQLPDGRFMRVRGTNVFDPKTSPRLGSGHMAGSRPLLMDLGGG